MSSHKKAIVVGISGCSSSGKTTLARLLRDIFPNTFILHEDDFYKPEDQLPVKDGLVDWDCAEAISVPDMEEALRHIHNKGTVPVSSSSSSNLPSTTTPTTDPSSSSSLPRKRRLSHRSSHGCRPHPPPPPSTGRPFSLTPVDKSFIASKEDQNSIGACPVPDSVIAAQKSRVTQWLSPTSPGHALLTSDLHICLLDGFLLYTPSTASIISALDIKLFLLVSHASAKARREARDGYVTLEGFWKDPPGYVDKIVWPNYVENHAWLFEQGDVEGTLSREVLAREGIKAQMGAGLDVPMEKTLEWAVGVLMHELERLVLGRENVDA